MHSSLTVSNMSQREKLTCKWDDKVAAFEAYRNRHVFLISQMILRFWFVILQLCCPKCMQVLLNIKYIISCPSKCYSYHWLFVHTLLFFFHGTHHRVIKKNQRFKFRIQEFSGSYNS